MARVLKVIALRILQDSASKSPKMTNLNFYSTLIQSLYMSSAISEPKMFRCTEVLSVRPASLMFCAGQCACRGSRRMFSCTRLRPASPAGKSARCAGGGALFLQQRCQSSDTLPQDQPPPAPNPHTLAQPDLTSLFIDIRKALYSDRKELEEIACYYFDGQGKVIRPVITVLVARAVNKHISKQHRLLSSQLEIAKVTEMIHTASLLHDDVLDMADTRRGKPSATQRYGQRKVKTRVLFIMAIHSNHGIYYRIQFNIAFTVQVLTDLVQGEFMQLGSKEKEDERFSHYLDKSFKKTASLIANSCQAVAILGGADKMVQQMCYQYGRNVGIAFQLVDDFLDFAASSNIVGKPTAVDLRLGMATAPVLFACEKFPELIPMILRRFSEPGDVEFAMECVHRSDGLQQTKLLATQHCLHAISMLQQLAPSQEKLALIAITDRVINRIR
ncbi:all trans-polyprenyl-diphosphate synthase PDSS1 [Hyalella azteca]|uniref:All trans-polyprenyl-diphosphate synthase PDSS1 n=1 Tax=Hyalella azteca TaxID=294128 RepID=A0A979FYI4_HYAAZ|nr:all trans-polyprenyl-diphosphate synthase PDSS1 [Hyalella azteca]